MSSEMRELVEDWRSGRLSGYVGLTKTERAVLRVCASELELRLARTEAGPSLLCQSDACAHKGTAHNFCTPRTEAGADGAVAYRVRRGNGSWGIPHEYLPGSPATIAALCDEGCEVHYLHPQDASGDAERFAAVMNCQWLRSSKYGDQVLGWREEFLSRVNAEVAAMQAKEAK